jgi:hypothetical protein
MKPNAGDTPAPEPVRPVRLSPELDKHIFKIAKVMATKIVGRHYPELLDDAVSMAALRAWKAHTAGMNLPTQAWAAKMGALEVLRDKIGKTGKKSVLYHAESLDAITGNGETRSMDTRAEMGEEDKTIAGFLKHGGDGELFDALLKLVPDRRRQLVMRRHYGTEEMTFREIGKRLRPPVSESRVCQFHIEAIRSLRAALKPFEGQYTSFDEFADLILGASRCFRCKQLRIQTEMPHGRHAICTYCAEQRRTHRNTEERRRRAAKRPAPKGPVKRTHVCRICERSLSRSLFHTRSERLSGLSSYCLECYNCVRGSGAVRKTESFSDRIPFLRACWRVAWQEKLIEGKRRRPPNGRSTLLVTSVDELRTFPGVLRHLKQKFSHNPKPHVNIPPLLITEWLVESPNEFNTKKWASKTGKHQTTIERWLHKMHDAAEIFVQTEKEKVRKR